MKKVVVFCSLMLFGIVNVSAMKLEIKKGDDIIYYNYESKTIDGNEVFKLSFDEVNEYDKWLVANLAQQAKCEDDFNKAVIQKMILESVNENYAINVIDNNDVIDTSDNEKNIMKKIEKYNKINDMNGNCYEVNLYKGTFYKDTEKLDIGPLQRNEVPIRVFPLQKDNNGDKDWLSMGMLATKNNPNDIKVNIRDVFETIPDNVTEEDF